MNTINHSRNLNRTKGFTLVEIMIVVVIIGILATMAGVAFKHTRQRSVATRVANDFRIFADAVQTYTLENGKYPADVGPATLPPGMEDYIKASSFTAVTPAGGLYDWDQGVFGVAAGISLHNSTAGNDVLLEIDKILDNGDLGSGLVRMRSGGLIYIIEGQ